MNHLVRIVATFFYAGYSPFVAGTVGSLFAIALAYAVKGNDALYISTIFIVFLLGLWSSEEMIKITHNKDPHCVVIDEVLGMLITLYALPFTPAVVISGFFLFRAFDMFKIYPINRLERLPGAWGIMLDDVMAAFYAHTILWVALLLIN